MEAPPLPPLTVRLFGPTEVRVAGRPLGPLRTRRGLDLLALLVLRHGREAERAWLAETLWPDSATEDALANLRRVLTDLRRALGEEAGRIAAPTRNTLRFDAAGADIDVLAFDAGIASADEAAREEAVALYRGTLLEGCYQDWALAEQGRREELYAAARTALAEAAAKRADHARAARHWKALTAADPLSESAWRGWMTALADGGEPHAALEAYRRLRDVLRRENRGAPDPETVAVYERVRAQAEREAPPEPAASTLGHLPAPTTPFVGRAAALERVSALLADERLVTVLGPGGIGKTRLALRVGEALRPRFPDGTWFADLAPVTDPALAPAAVARLFGVREAPGESLTDTLACQLGRRRLLLILDNCEHVAPAAADLTYRLLFACPELRILATSRQALGLSGEAVFPLPPLPDAEAAELFLLRARAASAELAAGGRVAELCRRLDGIPLALELAAARLGVLGLEEIAARLSDRFRLLTGGGSDRPERHRTLRAALDWSWELLDSPERELLCRLSVFAGGATLDAVRAVAGFADDYETLDAVQSLVARSLLFAAPDPAGSGSRYRMLETVREYARARAEPADLADAHRRLIEWLLPVALPHDKEQVGWLDSLDRERDNLRAALDFLVAHSERFESGLHLAYWLGTFFAVRGNAAEGVRVYGALLSKLAPDDPVRPGLLTCAGRMAMLRNDLDAARAHFADSLRLATGPKDIAAACAYLGNVALAWDDLEEAEAMYEESRQRWAALGDAEQATAKLGGLGIVRYRRGDRAGARRLLTDAIAENDARENRLSNASLVPYLGHIARDEGRRHDERAHYEDALALRRETGDARGAAEMHLLLARAEHERSRPSAARRHRDAATRLLRKAGEDPNVGLDRNQF